MIRDVGYQPILPPPPRRKRVGRGPVIRGPAGAPRPRRGDS